MSKSAMARSVSLTDQATLDYTINLLEQSFDLSAHGYRCRTHDLYRVLVTAAARQSTIEATCNALQNAPDSNTVRGYLAAQLTADGIASLEAQCNRALAQGWPAWLGTHPVEVAADLHDVCYYGDYDPNDDQQWVHKAQKRNGTHLFYRCATLFTIRNSVRVTLAVAFVRPHEALVDVLRKLLRTVRASGLQIGCLYADKEFCSIAVLRALEEEQLSAIIPVPRRGAPGGVEALCQGRSSFFTTYTFRNAQESWTTKLAVVRAYKKHRREARRATWLVYALVRVEDSLPHIRERYRHRFGIETGYRLVEQVRARTTSVNPALRFFLLGLALILVNVWVSLQWAYLRLAGAGPRRVARADFTLERMTCFLIHVVEAIYGVVVVVPRPP